MKRLMMAASVLATACAQAPAADPPKQVAAVVAPAAAPVAEVKASTSLAPPADAPPVKAQAPGPYKVVIVSDPSLPTHTIYRPADLSAFNRGNMLPVVAWGNGACSNAGLLFQNFLKQIASHGYLVIASGPRDAPMPSFASGGGEGDEAPDPNSGIKSAMTTDADMIKALDWAYAVSFFSGGTYEGKINTERMAVIGQSCGGLQATAAAADPRVKTVVIWNSGTFSPGASPSGASMSGATKESIAKFHTPVAYFPGGPSDLAYANSRDDFSRVTGVSAFFGSIHVGHGGTFRQPGGGWFGEVGVAWLDWQLKGSADAAKYFVGADCRLCTNPVWEVAKKNLN